MVLYKCDRCRKKFNQKCKYYRHINRKIPCLMTDDICYYCDICDKYYSRADAYNRHKKTTIHQDAGNISKNNTFAKYKIDNKNCNIATNTINEINYNNCIINKYVENHITLSPFGCFEINDLSIDDKLLIFSSDENPIIMIIIKTNLNPELPKYLNVGYEDLKSGYGYIYNGKTWKSERIDTILRDLLNLKENDLIKIHNELKDYLTEEDNKNIRIKLEDIHDNVKPRLDHHIKSKKNMVISLKNLFYNNRNLLIESMKNSGKPVIGPPKFHQVKNMLKEGITIQDIEKELDQKYRKSRILKEIAIYILDMIKHDIDGKQLLLIINKIEQTDNIDNLNSIVNSLSNSLLFGSMDAINSGIINKKIFLDTEIKKYMD